MLTKFCEEGLLIRGDLEKQELYYAEVLSVAANQLPEDLPTYRNLLSDCLTKLSDTQEAWDEHLAACDECEDKIRI